MANNVKRVKFMVLVWVSKAIQSDVRHDLEKQGIAIHVGLSNPDFLALHKEAKICEKTPVVIACGAKIVAKLKTLGVSVSGIKAVRGKELYVNGLPLVITYDPTIRETDGGYSDFVSFLCDIRIALRWHETGKHSPKLGDYRWVDDFGNDIDFIKSMDESVPVALDLETTGLNPFAEESWIVSVSVTYKDSESSLVHKPAGSLIRSQLEWLLNSRKVKLYGANLKFDLVWLRVKMGLVCTNLALDTLLVGSLLDENRSNSLKTHARLFTEMGGYDDELSNLYDKGTMEKVPLDTLIRYAGGDTDVTLKVGTIFREKLIALPKLLQLYLTLVKPASRCLENMQIRGIVVDLEYFAELREKWIKDRERANKRALELIPDAISDKYVDNLSLTRSVLLSDLFFTDDGFGLTPEMTTEKTGAPSTAMDHLKRFEDVPVVKDFMLHYTRYSKLGKLVSTYIDGFLNHVQSDGRLHPTALMFRGEFGSGSDSGTVTGRMTFKDPAIQTLPKHSEDAKILRKGYIAPEGYSIVMIDYAQGELKIMACVANEQAMIEAYKNGIDLHLKTGAELNGIPLEKALEMMQSEDQGVKKKVKAIRQGGKAGNFGLLYGMSAQGFKEYAQNSYGVSMSMEEAEARRNKFFDTYPGLLPFHENVRNHVLKHGFIYSPLGRRRLLPQAISTMVSVRNKAVRQAINAPIQSTLADLATLTLAEWHRLYGDMDECYPVMNIYDALGFYIRDDKISKWTQILKDMMENLPLKDYFNWEPQLKFTVDMEVGKNLAELKPVSF